MLTYTNRNRMTSVPRRLSRIANAVLLRVTIAAFVAYFYVYALMAAMDRGDMEVLYAMREATANTMAVHMQCHNPHIALGFVPMPLVRAYKESDKLIGRWEKRQYWWNLLRFMILFLLLSTILVACYWKFLVEEEGKIRSRTRTSIE